MNDTTETGVPTLAASFSRATRDHLAKLREGERKVRTEGDLEGVHLMRTSCRRLRATVKYLGDPLPRKSRKQLQGGLRELMTALGTVRDLDVLRQSLDTVPSMETREGEELKESVEERLARATERMQDVLDGVEYECLVKDLEIAAGVADDRVPATRVAPARIGAALAQVMELQPSDWTAAPEESLHDLRKSVKKMRYALEAFAPVYGKPVERAIERCRGLQESLGTIQDASAFGELLKGVRTFSAGQFTATLRARATREIDGLPELWKKTFGPKGLSRLGGHLFRRATQQSVPSVDAEEDSQREAV
ncbi:MAG TPA: CHAD domain-containing protein [Planctomycetota bacterium]|nr:CHAD domain-containing protein [Planctomycetota bacterium]